MNQIKSRWGKACPSCQQSLFRVGDPWPVECPGCGLRAHKDCLGHLEPAWLVNMDTRIATITNVSVCARCVARVESNIAKITDAGLFLTDWETTQANYKEWLLSQPNQQRWGKDGSMFGRFYVDPENFVGAVRRVLDIVHSSGPKVSWHVTLGNPNETPHTNMNAKEITIPNWFEHPKTLGLSHQQILDAMIGTAMHEAGHAAYDKASTLAAAQERLQHKYGESNWAVAMCLNIVCDFNLEKRVLLRYPHFRSYFHKTALWSMRAALPELLKQLEDPEAENRVPIRVAVAIWELLCRGELAKAGGTITPKLRWITDKCFDILKYSYRKGYLNTEEGKLRTSRAIYELLKMVTPPGCPESAPPPPPPTPQPQQGTAQQDDPTIGNSQGGQPDDQEDDNDGDDGQGNQGEPDGGTAGDEPTDSDGDSESDDDAGETDPDSSVDQGDSGSDGDGSADEDADDTNADPAGQPGQSPLGDDSDDDSDAGDDEDDEGELDDGGSGSETGDEDSDDPGAGEETEDDGDADDEAEADSEPGQGDDGGSEPDSSGDGGETDEDDDDGAGGDPSGDGHIDGEPDGLNEYDDSPYCRSCGEDIQEGDETCPVCGADPDADPEGSGKGDVDDDPDSDDDADDSDEPGEDGDSLADDGNGDSDDTDSGDVDSPTDGGDDQGIDSPSRGSGGGGGGWGEPDPTADGGDAFGDDDGAVSDGRRTKTDALDEIHDQYTGSDKIAEDAPDKLMQDLQGADRAMDLENKTEQEGRAGNYAIHTDTLDAPNRAMVQNHAERTRRLAPVVAELKRTLRLRNVDMGGELRNRRSGVLTRRHIPRLAAFGKPDVFHKDKPGSVPKVRIGILVDESGSMASSKFKCPTPTCDKVYGVASKGAEHDCSGCGQHVKWPAYAPPWQHAKDAATALAQALHGIKGTKLWVWGYSSQQSEEYLRSRGKAWPWQAVLRPYSDPTTNTFTAIETPPIQSGTPTMEAMYHAAKTLLKGSTPDERKVVFVVTDGEPDRPCGTPVREYWGRVTFIHIGIGPVQDKNIPYYAGPVNDAKDLPKLLAESVLEVLR